MTLMKPSALAAVAVLAVAGCAASPTATEPSGSTAESSVLSAHDLAGLDGREIVDQLDRLPVDERQPELMASVRPAELLLSENGSEEQTAVELPEHEFYLSVAPYVEQTHECYFHSLTTCRGELANEEVDVLVTDRDTGEVLVDETTVTFDNGFIGMWLPSGIDATVQIGYDGYSAAEDISTGPEDPTCLTTLHLAPSN